MAMAETSTQEKAKKLCYERRAACIMKKAMELQILCDLKIGVVILSPDGKLESWPPQLNDVKALLHTCKERPGVKSEKRKDPAAETCSHSCREILVSKLQLLNQREEFIKSAKGKEIATTKKRKGFSEGCLEILNSKLELLKKREMVFLNRSGNEIVSVEGIESLYDGAVVAYGQGDVLTQNLGPLYDDLGDEYTSIDEFFSFEEDKSNNLVADPQSNGTFKGKEIATMENMDSGILQYTTHLGAYQCDENGELTSMNNGISNKGLALNQWHHGSSSANHTLQAGSVRFEACYPPLPLQSSFTALGNGLPPIAAEECGELQARKKARLQNSTAAFNNNLPIFTSTEYWETMLTNAGLIDSTDAMMSLLDNDF
nr:agamous-like MADS-box protein AGL82 [Ipomoea batatas]GMC90536.1 agamous-like MADS-box protein AGL82 [Ipomoea batatas]